MRILLLANNIVGLEIAKYLKKRKEKVVGLGIHPKEKQKFTKEIINVFNLPKERVFDGSGLRNPKVLKRIEKLKPDIIIAAFWGIILKEEILQIPRMGAINFHPGYLPYNRGMNPNVWPFIENTPAGVSIHYIDNGVDTGDIIARKKINITPTDTAGSLYDKTLTEIIDLFKVIWPMIKKGEIKKIKQSSLKEKSTSHRLSQAGELDKIDLSKKYSGRELINLLRARSYRERFFAYYEENGKKVYIRVELSDKST